VKLYLSIFYAKSGHSPRDPVGKACYPWPCCHPDFEKALLQALRPSPCLEGPSTSTPWTRDAPPSGPPQTSGAPPTPTSPPPPPRGPASQSLNSPGRWLGAATPPHAPPLPLPPCPSQPPPPLRRRRESGGSRGAYWPCWGGTIPPPQGFSFPPKGLLPPPRASVAGNIDIIARKFPVPGRAREPTHPTPPPPRKI